MLKMLLGFAKIINCLLYQVSSIVCQKRLPRRECFFSFFRNGSLFVNKKTNL